MDPNRKLLDEIEADRRECNRALLALALLAILIALGMAFVGCAPRPPQPAKVEARLTYTPELPTHFNPITLTARLIVPEGVSVPCPRISWEFPDGTHSVHAADCDPDDSASGRVDVKRGMLPAGEHQFRVTFDSQGQAWSVETTVPVL